jgi:hypothetical protein
MTTPGEFARPYPRIFNFSIIRSVPIASRKGRRRRRPSATTSNPIEATKFLLGPFQSLCGECHRSAKRYVELRGYRLDIGPDGWPTDPRHPVYGSRR